MIDHIVIVTGSLHADAEWFAGQTGVSAEYGGINPVNGTHNMLFPLNGGAYLELLAANPGQRSASRPVPFGLDTFTGCAVATWAATAPDFDAAVFRARAQGVPLGELLDMSRRRPDGTTLHWRMTYPSATDPERLCPFLIDWGATTHPSAQLSGSEPLTLTEFAALTPEPGELDRWLAALGLQADVRVARSRVYGFALAVSGPAGQVRVRGSLTESVSTPGTPRVRSAETSPQAAR